MVAPFTQAALRAVSGNGSDALVVVTAAAAHGAAIEFVDPLAKGGVYVLMPGRCAVLLLR